MSEATRVKKKYEDLLLGMKGVTGIGVNGSIIVYVDRLTPELQGVLPRQLDGIAVHVKETGRVRLLSISSMAAIYGNRTGRWRPAPGGVSLGHPACTAGTLTCGVLDRRSLQFLGGLTNNHVGALNWGDIHIGKKGDPILQPGPYDGGREPADEIGELLDWVEVTKDSPNLVDASIFSSNELKKDVLDIGSPSHTVEPRVGMKVTKSGRTSGVNYGSITDVSATIKVDGGEGWGECIFKEQIILEPAMLQPGDSGSWVGEIDSFNTVGLGFAGSESLSIANPALTVEQLLDVVIVPPVPPIKLRNAFGLVAVMFGLGVSFMIGGKKKR
jgi:hypothetical protein